MLLCAAAAHPPLNPHRFPSLRSIVVCFLEAIPLLVSVVAMMVFFLFIFAVAGVELFPHAYHMVRCLAASRLLGAGACAARSCAPSCRPIPIPD